MWMGWNWGLLWGGGVSAEAPGDVVDYVLFCYGRDPLNGLEPQLGL